MKIGCLHAHYSNIEYIQAAIGSKAELIHFVDPGLMMRIAKDFDDAGAKEKVSEQIKWITQSGVDAILITCTNYIALLEEVEADIPIIKIDEPFFNEICKKSEPQVLLFTNPATVKGTMKRMMRFASLLGQRLPDIEVRVIGDAFPLIMQGQKAEYIDEVRKSILEMLRSEPGKNMAVAQLSMVEAAKKAAQELNISIGNPLEALESFFSGEDLYYTGKHLHVGNWDDQYSSPEEGIAWERLDGTMDLYYLDPDSHAFRGLYICNVKSEGEAQKQFVMWIQERSRKTK